MESKIIGNIQVNQKQIGNDLLTVNVFPDIKEEYSEFGVGTWKNNSLWNASGDL